MGLDGDLSSVVGELLRDRIRAKGVNQTTVASAAQMSQSQLSRCLSGHRRWDLDQFAVVCKYLGTKASDLLAVAEDMLGEA